MTIESDVVTALASVASGRVYPDAAPEDATLPFVVYRKIESEPLMTLMGYAGSTRTNILFECWGASKSSAITTAGNVQTAIEAAVGIATKYREAPGNVEYEPRSDQYMEPVVFSFWHA